MSKIRKLPETSTLDGLGFVLTAFHSSQRDFYRPRRVPFWPNQIIIIRLPVVEPARAWSASLLCWLQPGNKCRRRSTPSCHSRPHTGCAEWSPCRFRPGEVLGPLNDTVAVSFVVEQEPGATTVTSVVPSAAVIPSLVSNVLPFAWPSTLNVQSAPSWAAAGCAPVVAISPKARKAAKATTARVAGTGQSLFAFFVLITPFSPCNLVGKQPDRGPALPVRFWYKQLVLSSLLQSRAARQGLSGVVGSRRRRWARPHCRVS